MTVLVVDYPPTSSTFTIVIEPTNQIPIDVVRVMAMSYFHLAYERCGWELCQLTGSVSHSCLMFGDEVWGEYHPDHQSFVLTLTSLLMETVTYNIQRSGDAITVFTDVTDHRAPGSIPVLRYRPQSEVELF